MLTTLVASLVANTDKLKRPNVLFIAIDDLRTELGCYGASHIKSPNIDRLAESGIRFSKAHVQQAICMASRASIMSGLRPEKRKIYTGESVTDLIPDVVTLNKFFANNGYTIASCGKIYHFGADTIHQFGDAEMTPDLKTTGRGYIAADSIAKIKLNKAHQRGPAYESADVSDTTYKDGINAHNAVERMAELSQEDAPFFMAVGFSKPHLPFVAPKKYWDLYPEETISMPEVRKHPENTSKYVLPTSGELTNYYGMPNKYSAIDEATTLTLRRGYYACVSYVDAQVGKLLDQVKALGLEDNTIIVLWGDHGFKLGDYSSWCKWSNLKIDTNIPLIFRIPGGKQNKVSHTPVEALDIYPTLAELCGLEMPGHLEGQSIVRNLTNPEKTEARTVETIWPHYRKNYKRVVMGFSAKDARYNYVEWVQFNSGEILAKELYDHKKDPMETVNVIADPHYAEVITRLSQKTSEIKAGADHRHALNQAK